MAQAFYLGAYWGARQESLDASAARLATLAKSLAAVHEDLSTWFRKGESAEAATSPVDLTGPDAAALLSAGRQRKDIGGETMAELGFRAAVWNRRPQPVELSVICGAYPSYRPIANNVLLKFPPLDSAPDLYAPTVVAPTMKAVIDAFMPDWATFTSHPLRTAQGAKLGELIAGWVTYVSRPVGIAVAGGSAEAYRSGSILTLGQSAAEVTADRVIQARAALAN